MKKKTFTNKQTADFCRSLALLLHAGIGLSDAMLLCGEDMAEPWAEKAASALDAGSPLHSALEESGLFTAHLINMVHVGESSGRLEEALKCLADYYRVRHESIQSLRQALSYPCMVMALAFAVVCIIITKVLPVFDSVYASLGSRLTGPAAVLMQLGMALNKALPSILVGLLAAAVITLICMLFAPVKHRLRRLWLGCFGDRGIMQAFNNACFAQGLAMAFKSGLAPEDAVYLCREGFSHIPAFAVRCNTLGEKLREGKNPAKAMASTGFLSPALGRLLSAGTKSGRADTVMEEISLMLMKEAQEKLDRRIAAIEPAMVLLCALLVGVILLSVMLPLVNIISAIG